MAIANAVLVPFKKSARSLQGLERNSRGVADVTLANHEAGRGVSSSMTSANKCQEAELARAEETGTSEPWSGLKEARGKERVFCSGAVRGVAAERATDVST